MRATETTRQRLVRHGARGRHLLLAVSGGSDSIALLDLCRRLAPGLDLQLTVAHVRHAQRPEAATEAEAVGALSRHHGLHFRVADPPAATRNASEETLRRLRHEALDRIAKDTGAWKVATAHTRDDQIETALFRFLRGSGRLGRAGIHPSTPTRLRPLIDIDKASLQTHLRGVGQGWFEDRSNTSHRYRRNWIRHGLLPTIRAELGDGALDHLARSTERLLEEESFLDLEARRFAEYCFAPDSGSAALVADVANDPDANHARAIHIDSFHETPQALRPRILRFWLGEFRRTAELDLTHIQAVLQLADSACDGTLRPATATDLPGFRVVSDGVFLRVRKAPG